MGLTLGLLKKFKCLNFTSIFITFLTREANYSRTRGDKKKRPTDLDSAQKIPIGTVNFSDGIDFGTCDKIKMFELYLNFYYFSYFGSSYSRTRGVRKKQSTDLDLAWKIPINTATFDGTVGLHLSGLLSSGHPIIRTAFESPFFLSFFLKVYCTY